MLEKIEAAYLAVMRVVVLVAATVALVVCIVGASFAAPVILHQLGLGSDAKPSGVNLAEFVQEQKIGQGSAEAPLPATEGAQTPGKLARASELISAYVAQRSREQVDREALDRYLTEKRDAVEADQQGAYQDSVLELATQLKASTGRPLSLARVAQLLDWHATRFVAGVEAQKVEALSRAAKASAGMTLAAGGLIAFILILFFFLFVKIERNLRVVQTREVAAP